MLRPVFSSHFSEPPVNHFRHYLEGVDDGLNVRLHGFMGKLRAGQSTHTLQSQVPQVSLSVLQELAQLVTGSHQQVWLTAEQKPNLLHWQPGKTP